MKPYVATCAMLAAGKVKHSRDCILPGKRLIETGWKQNITVIFLLVTQL